MPATKRAATKVPAHTEPIPVIADVETWRNETAGIVIINRVGEYGRKVVDVIQGGRTFQVTPQERRMNQNACADPTLDVFTNGTLRAIDLLDDEPDTEKLKNNPNALSDEDLARLFRLKGDNFKSRIDQITNPVALARIVEVARDPRFEASLQQYEMVRSRELEVKGEVNETTPEREKQAFGRAVTPK